jgi:hypothetical protein
MEHDYTEREYFFEGDPRQTDFMLMSGYGEGVQQGHIIRTSVRRYVVLSIGYSTRKGEEDFWTAEVGIINEEPVKRRKKDTSLRTEMLHHVIIAIIGIVLMFATAYLVVQFGR